MSIYNLATNITAVQAQSVVNPNGGSNPLVDPWSSDDNPNGPVRTQTFTALLNGVGNCSATVQFVASNDGINLIAYGPPLVVSAASADLTPGLASQGGNQGYEFFGCYITAISGTKASVNVQMSA
jgi:hypothetical protein